MGFFGCDFPQVENRCDGEGPGVAWVGFRVREGLVVTGLGTGAGVGLAVVGLCLGGEDGVESSSESETHTQQIAEYILSVICELNFTLMGSNEFFNLVMIYLL